MLRFATRSAVIPTPRFNVARLPAFGRYTQDAYATSEYMQNAYATMTGSPF
jgi:hypothetical protein